MTIREMITQLEDIAKRSGDLAEVAFLLEQEWVEKQEVSEVRYHGGRQVELSA